MPYELECESCSEGIIKNRNKEEAFCHNCGEISSFSLVQSLESYTVIIEVQGSIEHNGQSVNVSGVTGRQSYASSKDKAKRKAIKAFRNNPDYNTDISVDKSKFPDGRYLDDWGYRSGTATAIDAISSEELHPTSVRWRDRGILYCQWENSF